jgi:TonB family protein
MALSGHTREFALADVIQVKALQRSDCRIVVDGPAGAGELVLEKGHAVHAVYGGLKGADAAYELLIEDDLRYRVENGPAAEERSMRIAAQELVMEAMRLLDEGLLRIPRRTAADVMPTGTNGGYPTVEVLVPPEPAAAAAEAPARPRGRRFPWLPVAAALLALAVVAGAMFWVLREPQSRGETAPGGAATAAVPAEPFEAADLTGPGDRKPTLLVGRPPATPLPDRPLRPTIVCRVLIDAAGAVAEARVYRPRPDLQVFEKTALVAVRGYRFAPAERDGAPVPVWINWPVDFV